MRAKDLFEKSTSQAQFRTMAAAANNPKFAKKVGISQDVAREFHAADRKSDYKKLPDHANESQLNELFDADQQYFKLADGQVIRADFTQAGLNPDGMSSSIKISTVDPKIMPSAATTAVQPWDKARPNIRAAIQKWVQGGQQTVSEIKKGQKDSNGYTKCWPGKHAEGTKKSAVTGKQVRNCVPNEGVEEAANPAQQAAIAIAMKKAGQKPKSQGVAEAGPFSYGSKAPRKGSVADLAAKKRKEQQKGKQPVEPKDQMVGVAKVITKGVAEGSNDWSGPLYDSALQGNGKKQRYEMMFKNGQVKRVSAMNDNEARKIAAGHGAKSVIRMKGNVPGDKIKEQGVAEARGKDQDQFGGMHQDDFQEKLMRLKKLAQAGPMKTVYDPNKRVYKNMPTAVQPPRQPKK
jgi:hypothetical protein